MVCFQVLESVLVSKYNCFVLLILFNPIVLAVLKEMTQVSVKVVSWPNKY